MEPSILFNKFTGDTLKISFNTHPKGTVWDGYKSQPRLIRSFACSTDPKQRDAQREMSFYMYKKGVPYVCSPGVCGLDNSVFHMRMWCYNMIYAPWVISVVAMDRYLMLMDTDRIIDGYVEHAERYATFVKKRKRDEEQGVPVPPEPVCASQISRELEVDFSAIDSELLREYADVLDTLHGWTELYSVAKDRVEESINTQMDTMHNMAEAYDRLREVKNEKERAECTELLNDGRDWFLNNFRPHHDAILSDFISKQNIVGLRPVVDGIRDSCDDSSKLPSLRAMLIVPQEIKEKVEAAMRAHACACRQTYVCVRKP